MYLDEIREFCLGLDQVTEGFPFDNRTLVFKNPGGMFCLLDVEWEKRTLNLKCSPQRSLQLREAWPEQIAPGWHMNKTHWNTVDAEGLPSDLLLSLIRHSYDLVKQKKGRGKKNKSPE